MWVAPLAVALVIAKDAEDAKDAKGFRISGAGASRCAPTPPFDTDLFAFFAFFASSAIRTAAVGEGAWLQPRSVASYAEVGCFLRASSIPSRVRGP